MAAAKKPARTLGHKLIIAGSRDIDDVRNLEVALRLSRIDPIDISIVISGACGLKKGETDVYAEGVDGLGEQWADKCDIPVNRFYAKWDEEGDAAGPKRNRRMAKKATHLLAVWDGESKGTKSMIREAARAGVKTYVYVVPEGRGYGWLEPKMRVVE